RTRKAVRAALSLIGLGKTSMAMMKTPMVVRSLPLFRMSQNSPIVNNSCSVGLSQNHEAQNHKTRSTGIACFDCSLSLSIHDSVHQDSVTSVSDRRSRRDAEDGILCIFGRRPAERGERTSQESG